VASTILSDKNLSSKYTDYASSLLSSLVNGVVELYGKTELVYNIHCLLHIVDDVARYGPLDSYSAYPFENKLKQIKRLVRRPSLPLQQAARCLLTLKTYKLFVCLCIQLHQWILSPNHVAKV